MSQRNEKIKEALRESAAEFLASVAGPQSLITVTGAQILENGRSASILITVLPESAEEAALAFANRNRRKFSEFFTKRVRGVRPLRAEFLIDRGEKNRQRLDQLS